MDNSESTRHELTAELAAELRAARPRAARARPPGRHPAGSSVDARAGPALPIARPRARPRRGARARHGAHRASVRRGAARCRAFLAPVGRDHRNARGCAVKGSLVAHGADPRSPARRDRRQSLACRACDRSPVRPRLTPGAGASAVPPPRTAQWQESRWGCRRRHLLPPCCGFAAGTPASASVALRSSGVCEPHQRRVAFAIALGLPPGVRKGSRRTGRTNARAWP